MTGIRDVCLHLAGHEDSTLQRVTQLKVSGFNVAANMTPRPRKPGRETMRYERLPITVTVGNRKLLRPYPLALHVAALADNGRYDRTPQ